MMTSDEIDRQIEAARELREDVRRAMTAILSVTESAVGIADDDSDDVTEILILPMMERVWEAYENLSSARAMADLAEVHVRHRRFD